METAEPSDRCDSPGSLRRSMERSIFVERKVRAYLIVVSAITCQQMAQVPFSQHHDMVEALASDRSDQPLNMTVLPRRTWRDWSVANAHGSQPACYCGTIGRVTVSDEIARCLIPWKCFGDLLGGSTRRLDSPSHWSRRAVAAPGAG